MKRNQIIMRFLLFPSLPFLYSSRPLFPSLFFSSRFFSFLFYSSVFVTLSSFFSFTSYSLLVSQSHSSCILIYFSHPLSILPSLFQLLLPLPLFLPYTRRFIVQSQNLPAQYRHKDCLYFLFKWFKFSPLRICISECLFGPPACNHIGAGMRFLFPTVIHKTRHIIFQLYHIMSYDTV